jgi:hypothetical protein
MIVNNITVSAVQDLLAVYAGTSKIFAVLYISIGQVTSGSVANQRMRLRYLPATVSAGSAGSAGVFKPTRSGDPAATLTGRINDTTQASSSGTVIDLWSGQWNIINGFEWVPPIPSDPPIIGISGALILSLDSAPASLVTNASILVEELP